ncbi:MAG: AI-2E family transporter [Deltaproteobacteria bacterium]|nr:AI-2E family transporter [Deltaproteobacteria bacterium]
MSGPGQAPVRTSAGAVLARVAAGVGMLVAALWVLRPFLVPVAWAGIAAYVTWPLVHTLRRRTGRPHLAAAIGTLTVALGLGIPVAWVLVALASEANHLVGAVRGWLDAGAPLPSWILARPEWSHRLEELRASAGIEPSEAIRFATQQAAAITGRLVDVAGGLAANVFKFAMTMVTLYVLYLEGETVVAHARRLARIAFPQAPESFVDDVGGVVRAVVFGLLGTALVQGLIAGIGYALFGVPSPVALGALTALGSLVPAGPLLVWGGAAIWLFAAGHTGAAIGMAIYGALLVSSIDNVLRPLLISRSPQRIHFLVVFFGVLGGLAAFGALGLFVGPVLLSVALALVAEFSGRGDPPVPDPGDTGARFG